MEMKAEILLRPSQVWGADGRPRVDLHRLFLYCFAGSHQLGSVLSEFALLAKVGCSATNRIRQPPRPPIVLGNIRTLPCPFASSCSCGHAGQAGVSTLGDEVAVPATRNRLRCSARGARPIDVRPKWLEHRLE